MHLNVYYLVIFKRRGIVDELNCLMNSSLLIFNDLSRSICKTPR